LNLVVVTLPKIGISYGGDMTKKIAAEVHRQGFIDSPEVRSLDIEECNKTTPMGGNKWGYNSRCRVIRARKLFGWTPKGEDIEKVLPSLVRDKGMRLGKTTGHAAKAAGEVYLVHVLCQVVVCGNSVRLILQDATECGDWLDESML
jgi:hypothetical protein